MLFWICLSVILAIIHVAVVTSNTRHRELSTGTHLDQTTPVRGAGPGEPVGSHWLHVDCRWQKQQLQSLRVCEEETGNSAEPPPKCTSGCSKRGSVASLSGIDWESVLLSWRVNSELKAFFSFSLSIFFLLKITTGVSVIRSVTDVNFLKLSRHLLSFYEIKKNDRERLNVGVRKQRLIFNFFTTIRERGCW